MRSFVPLTLAALARFSSAFPQHQHLHGRIHGERRDVETSVDIAYITVTEVVTAYNHEHGAGGWHYTETSSSTPTTTSSTFLISTETSTSAVVPTSSVGVSIETSLPTVSDYVPVSLPTSAPSSIETQITAASLPSTPSAMPSLTTPETTSSAISSAVAGSTGLSKSNLTPNGRKAGLSGYVGIQNTNAFNQFAEHISWYSDYTPNTPTEQGVLGVGMLWGASGSSCGSVETSRLDIFNSLVQVGTIPEIMFGFYEPDCSCPMSSAMSVSSAAAEWDALIAPLAAKGTVLGSPSMCDQYDEKFLTPFESSISVSWDVTSIHINKPNVSEAQKDVEYYLNTYKKPVWVSEFACVHDQPSWQPCTDQTEINQFINDVVKYFEGNENVVAYGPSNGEGLGTAWPLTTNSGELTTSGQTYLNAIKSL